jgi:biotin transporter BioY
LSGILKEAKIKNVMPVKNLTFIETILPNTKNLSLIKDIVLILGFAVLTGLAAQFKVEIGAVPITMQTFVVLLSGILLGSKKGAASQIIYLLMGLSGLPWFARGGGLGYILSPTFGYILGFILASYLVGLLIEKGWGKKIKTIIFVLLIGEAAIYLFGILWLAKFVGFNKALTFGFYPFILGDFLKLLLIIPFLFFNGKRGEIYDER